MKADIYRQGRYLLTSVYLLLVYGSMYEIKSELSLSHVTIQHVYNSLKVFINKLHIL